MKIENEYVKELEDLIVLIYDNLLDNDMSSVKSELKYLVEKYPQIKNRFLEEDKTYKSEIEMYCSNLKGLQMGYTHYWYRPQHLNCREFEKFAADVMYILQEAQENGIKLGDTHGENEPFVNYNIVAFNGYDESGYESCVIEKDVSNENLQPFNTELGEHFDFCKTQQKRYDEVVVAVLMCLQYHFPSIVLKTDGDYLDWAAGSKLFEDALGFNYEPKLGILQ